MSTEQKLTTPAGAPVGDYQNSLSAGPRGPMLMQIRQQIGQQARN